VKSKDGWRRHVNVGHIWLTPRWSDNAGAGLREDGYQRSGPAESRLEYTRMCLEAGGIDRSREKYTSRSPGDRRPPRSSESGTHGQSGARRPRCSEGSTDQGPAACARRTFKTAATARCRPSRSRRRQTQTVTDG